MFSAPLELYTAWLPGSLMISMSVSILSVMSPLWLSTELVRSLTLVTSVPATPAATNIAAMNRISVETESPAMVHPPTSVTVSAIPCSVTSFTLSGSGVLLATVTCSVSPGCHSSRSALPPMLVAYESRVW